MREEKLRAIAAATLSASFEGRIAAAAFFSCIVAVCTRILLVIANILSGKMSIINVRMEKSLFRLRQILNEEKESTNLQ